MEVTKEFQFDSCHNLLNYDGPCVRLHGHTYKLFVSLKKRIDINTDMALDFVTLKKVVKEHIIDKLDHYYLNDVLKFNTTAENMLVWIWERLEKDALLKGLVKIQLYETPTSCATLTYQDLLNSNYIQTYYYDLDKEE